ncbi:Myb/SANT-like DNA-binding domain [Popillia japonica]|uniref:Myb/SANT-like DNA-binding domain n=1 Tax=Popillia japonica TaxID=7064 RepID=A0AAW1IE60_POPJA
MAISNTILKAYMKYVVDGYYLLETEEGDYNYKLPVGIIDIESGTIIRIEDKFLKLVLPDAEENTENEDITDNSCNNIFNEKQVADWTEDSTKMWEIIRDEVNKYGYNYTSLQCQTKWRSLERAYKNKIDNNKKTGRGRKVCAFENELNDIFVKRNTVFPPCVMDAEMIRDREDLMNQKEINHELSKSSAPARLKRL